MTKLTAAELSAIEGREKAATEGPWSHLTSRDVWSAIIAPGVATICNDVERDSDAVFIANARADIPALLNHARELEREAEKYRLPQMWTASPLDKDTLHYMACEVSHDMRCEASPGEGEMRVRWNNRAVGMLLATIAHYESQIKKDEQS